MTITVEVEKLYNFSLADINNIAVEWIEQQHQSRMSGRVEQVKNHDLIVAEQQLLRFLNHLTSALNKNYAKLSFAWWSAIFHKFPIIRGHAFLQMLGINSSLLSGISSCKGETIAGALLEKIALKTKQQLQTQLSVVESNQTKLETFQVSHTFIINHLKNRKNGNHLGIAANETNEEYKTHCKIVYYFINRDWKKANEETSKLFSQITDTTNTLGTDTTSAPKPGKRKHGELFNPGEDTEKTARARSKQKGSRPPKKKNY